MIGTAVPALVTPIYGSGAIAEVGGQPREVGIFLTPEVRVGDYASLRNATTIISKPEALEILRLLEEIIRLDSDQHINPAKL